MISTMHRGPEVDLAVLAEPRSDLLIETEVEPGRFVQEIGPFKRYERRVEEVTVDGSRALNETIDFRLAMPVWWPLFHPMMKRALADPSREPRRRWWWPKEVLTSTSAVLVSVLMVISIIAGYLGVLIGQTMTFAAAEFEASDELQGQTLAAIRVGVLLSVVFIWRADRAGRRPLLIGFALGAILLTAVGALSPNLLALAISQALARGLDTGLLTLLTLAATEEVPAGVRGLALSLMTLCSGLGAGMVVWFLPLADLSVSGWRWIYVVPLAFLPSLWWAWRTMPETRRFSVAEVAGAPAKVNMRRFLLLASTSFAGALFLSPASQFQNEYLSDEVGFSATSISMFRLLISTPVGLVILAAGVIADRRGRKHLGAFGMAVGAGMGLWSYFQTGAPLWITALLSTWLLGAAYPALRTYQTELFPTRTRARVGGWLDAISVSGSAIGLLIVGRLSTQWGSLGPALSVMIFGPLIAACLVLFVFPETAGRELEEFNPDDPAL